MEDCSDEGPCPIASRVNDLMMTKEPMLKAIDYDAFISYAQCDSYSESSALAAVLKSAGLAAWLCGW